MAWPERERFELRRAEMASLSRSCDQPTMVDACWADRLCTTARIRASQGIPEVRHSIQRRLSLARILLLGSVSVHGVRSTDLPRESTRYRGVSARGGRQALSHGVPWQGGALYAGRRQ